MNNVYLIPNRFKIGGWVVLIPSIVLGIIHLFNDTFMWEALDWSVPWYWFNAPSDNFTNELLMLLVLFSALIVAFSKTKEEDEYVQKIRLDSLVWSMYLNYGIVFLGIVGVYGFAFLNVLVFNLFTPLFIFIARFNYFYYKR